MIKTTIQKGYFKLILTVILLLSVIFVGHSFSKILTGRSTITRLFFKDIEDINTIATRFDFWHQAIIIGSSQPIFGVGLGNFYEYVDKSPRNSFIDPKRKELFKSTAAHPYNIFFASYAETGFVGIVALILLLASFFINDLKIYYKKNILSNLLIISFWSVFLYSLVGPKTVVQYASLFWLLRALIQNSQTSN